MNKQVSYAYQHLSRTETTNTYLGQRHIIKKYIELGGKKVVLGSDAHNCSFLGNGYDCIRKNLPLELEIGYFKNREFVGINSNTFE